MGKDSSTLCESVWGLKRLPRFDEDGVDRGWLVVDRERGENGEEGVLSRYDYLRCALLLASIRMTEPPDHRDARGHGAHLPTTHYL
jgi:hypothetical protein